MSVSKKKIEKHFIVLLNVSNGHNLVNIFGYTYVLLCHLPLYVETVADLPLGSRMHMTPVEIKILC
jgi:hypothetical protein